MFHIPQIVCLTCETQELALLPDDFLLNQTDNRRILTWLKDYQFVSSISSASAGRPPERMLTPSPTIVYRRFSTIFKSSGKGSSGNGKEDANRRSKAGELVSDPELLHHTEDSSYFLPDIVILVENTLFKVPRHHFEHGSDVFRTMFSLPCGEDTPVEGNSKERPLSLDGIVTKQDFLPFLKVICPKSSSLLDQLSYAELESALKLATMWAFEGPRNFAIDKLTSTTVDPITRLELIRAYDVRQWYWLVLRGLGEQEKPLSAHDVERLGLDFSLRVMELRGRVAGYKYAGESCKQAAFLAANDTITVFIREIFPKEVKNVPI